MANHYYIISEAKFHLDKDTDPKVWDFVKGTGINLNQKDEKNKVPTILDIRKAILDFGISVVNEQKKPSRLELHIAGENSRFFILIFTNVISENDENSFMFEIERSSNFDLAIEFIKFLSRFFGNFLFYCDSGAMSLITPNKDLKIIQEEMGS